MERGELYILVLCWIPLERELCAAGWLFLVTGHNRSGQN